MIKQSSFVINTVPNIYCIFSLRRILPMLLNSPFLSTSPPQIQSVMNYRVRRVLLTLVSAFEKIQSPEGAVQAFHHSSSFPQIQSMISEREDRFKVTWLRSIILKLITFIHHLCDLLGVFIKRHFKWTPWWLSQLGFCLQLGS